MRLFKKTYRDKTTNELRKLKKWYIEFRDHNEQIKKLPAFSDKARSMELSRKIERLVFCRITGEQPDPTLNQWLEVLPGPMRDKLGELDLLDGKRLAACKKLSDHLIDFKQSMLVRGVSERQVVQVHSRVLKVVEGCQFITWSDIAPATVMNFLYERRNAETKPISAQTSNFYLQAFKQFCRWMVKEQRASESPVDHLDGLNVKAHPQRLRRAFTIDELGRLIDTTWQGAVRLSKTRDGDIAWSMTGPERAMLYLVAVETGLRANELRSLTRSSFNLEGSNPTVMVQAAYSKRKRKDVQPLKPQTAARLAEVMGEKLPDAKVFRMPRRESLSLGMFQPDMQAAGVDYKDAGGRVADFHALRHTFITNLAQGGVHPKTAQALARHSTITLTMDRYTHSLQEDQTRALDVLPDLSSYGRESEAEKKAPHEIHGVLYGAHNVRKHAIWGDPLRQPAVEKLTGADT
ncbi:MAG: tyrosine-type recombinase/integrase [Phycisphaeraceae bacterium]|nr:tyrosine-type recombinase/integrase [Phycisphaeraceae bacterium]